MSRQHLRDAIRSLLRRRGFSTGVLSTMALGIGANVAVFSLVNAVVLRPLPYKSPDRLVWIWHSWTSGQTGPFSIPDLVEYQRSSPSFEGLSAFRLWGTSLTGQGEAERLTGIRVSENFFELLGVPALHGSVFTVRDAEPKQTVLGYGLWVRRFGADPAIVGASLALNGEAYVVTGVLPPGFLFPLPEAELAVPLAIDLDPGRHEPAVNGLRMVGRLHPHVGPVQAEAELERTTARLRALYPEDNAHKKGVTLVPVAQEILGGNGSLLLLLWGAVAVVLLMASANLANLFLTQVSVRRKELAVRRALGANSQHLFAQLLTEGLLLAALGGALGVLAARGGIEALLRIAPAQIPRADDARIDVTVLLFSVGLSVATGLLFALVPALHASRVDPLPGLQGETRGATGATSTRARLPLLAVQTALAVVLTVAAGLFLKSFALLLAVAPGFEPDQLLTIRLAMPQHRYADTDSLVRFYDRFRDRVTALSSVRAVAAISILPLSGYRTTGNFAVAGRPAPTPDQMPEAHYRIVTPAYFHAMGIPLVRGREFDERDREGKELVAVINETFERRYWPAGGAVGSELLVDDGEEPQRLRIVGVASDVRHVGLDQPIENDLYIPLRQMPQIDVPLLLNNFYLVVRARSDPAALGAAVRRQLVAADPDVAASQLRPMDDVLALAVAPRRFALLLLTSFASAALLLVVLGVYGVTNQMTIQRRREIGIRVAMGARPVNVCSLVMVQGLKPTVPGIFAGALVAVAGGRMVRSFLYQVSEIDVSTLMGAALAVIGVSALATLLPTVRASRVSPKDTLA